MNAANIEQKNTCHVNRFDQKLWFGSIILKVTTFNHRFLPVYRLVQSVVSISLYLLNPELDTSSIENNNPPTGEPKADETPAAAPADIKFRRSSGFRNRLK